MKRTFTIAYLLIMNIAVVSLLTALLVSGVLPIRPWAPLIAFFLMGIDILIVRQDFRAKGMQSTKRVPRKLWFAAFLFSGGASVAICRWAVTPSASSAFQAIAGTVLAGYVWFLVVRLRANAESLSERK